MNNTILNSKRTEHHFYFYKKIKLPYYDIVFIVFSICYFIFATHLWLETKGFPGYMFTNVDELYLTYFYALNWEQFGILNSFFLPDYATGLDPAAHPFVYTHNIAFPNYIVYIIRLLGLSEVYHISFVSMFIAYGGYSLAYFMFRRFVNPHLGIIVFCLIILDYKHVLTHSHTFFRSFQWVLFFLCPILFLKWQNNKYSLNNNRCTKFYKLAFGVAIGLTAAYEHALLLLSVLTIFMLYLHSNANPFKKRELFSLFYVLGISIITPFSGHLLCQILYFRDTSFVLIDQFGTYANRLIGYPDYDTIKKIYDNRNLVNYSYPATSTKDILDSLLLACRWFFNEYGWLSIIGMMFIFVFSIFSMREKIFFKRQFLIKAKKNVRILSCFLYPMLLFTLGVSYYIRSNYIGASLPLFEMYFIMYKGFILYLIFYFLFRLFSSKIIRIALALAVLIIVTKNLANSYFMNPPLPMPAFDVLSKYEGHSFSVNYHAQYPALFTKHWALSSAMPNSFVDENNILVKDILHNKEKYLKPEYYLELYMKSQSFHPEQIKALAPNAKLVESDWNYQIWKLNW